MLEGVDGAENVDAIAIKIDIRDNSINRVMLAINGTMRFLLEEKTVFRRVTRRDNFVKISGLFNKFLRTVMLLVNGI